MKKFTDGWNPYPVTLYVPFFKQAYNRSKLLDHQIKITLTYIYSDVNFGVTWNQYPKKDVHPSNRLQDTRQNHWTMKYVILTYIK